MFSVCVKFRLSLPRGDVYNLLKILFLYRKFEVTIDHFTHYFLIMINGGNVTGCILKKNLRDGVNTPNIPTDASVTASKPLSANHQTTEKIDSYKGIPDKCPSRCHLLINNKNPDIFSCSLCHQTTSIYNIPFKYSSEEIIVSNNQPMDYYVTKMKEVFLRQPIAKQEDNHKWDNFLNGNNSTVNGWSKAISTRTCTFCRRNSEGREFYESHSLKDSTGKVSCPVLRALKYPYCYADGYNAHTRKYCPLYKSVNETLPEPRRLANGTLASASNHK